MCKTTTVFASFVLCLTLVATAAAQGGAVKDIPATSTISDLSFRIESDGQGSYTNSSSVRSVVQTHGDWILDLSGSKRIPTTRSVLIDFHDPVVGTGPGGTPTAPFGARTVNARFIASCHRTGYDVNMLSMLNGAEETCPLNITFDDGGFRYGIAMNSVDTIGLGTEDVTITCLSAQTNQCNSWSIKPYVFSTTNGASSIGKLLKLATKPNQSDEDLGNFYFSFAIGVTIP